jgi:tetratricopeptide (TPR) repeat protein
MQLHQIQVPIGRRAFFLGASVSTPSTSSASSTVDGGETVNRSAIVGSNYFMEFDKKNFTKVDNDDDDDDDHDGDNNDDDDDDATTSTNKMATSGEKVTTQPLSLPTPLNSDTNSSSPAHTVTHLPENIKSDEVLFARLKELELLEEEEAEAKKINNPPPAPVDHSSLRPNNLTEIAALKKRMTEIKNIDDYDENTKLMKELKQLRARFRTLTQNNVSASSSVVAATTVTPETTSTTKSNAKIITKAVNKLKDAGNAAFKDKDYGTAISNYTDALVADTNHQQHHVLLSNRSLSWNHSRFFKEAATDAEKIIELKPQWPKGYYRLASAMYGSSKESGNVSSIDDALRTIELGLLINPKNKALLNLKNKIISESRNFKETVYPSREATNNGAKFAAVSKLENNTTTSKSLLNSKRTGKNSRAFSGEILERVQNHSTRPKGLKAEKTASKQTMSAFRRRRMGLE